MDGQTSSDPSVLARLTSLVRSAITRLLTIGRWAWAGMDEGARGLQSFAGTVVSLSMLTGYVLLLKLLVPGVFAWIDHHSLGNDKLWFLEVFVVGLVPVLIYGVVVTCLGRLARKVARHARR